MKSPGNEKPGLFNTISFWKKFSDLHSKAVEKYYITL